MTPFVLGDISPPSRKRKTRPEAENLEPGEVKRLGRTLESSVRVSLTNSIAEEIDKRLASITRSLGFRAQHDTVAGLHHVLMATEHRNFRRRRSRRTANPPTAHAH
jgi:hypothetical protein